MADKIIKHEWNGFEVRQVAEGMRSGDHLIPAGAVNLTDLCKTHGKVVAEFLRLPSTIAFCEAYQSKYGIFPYLATRGITGSTWVLLPLAMKVCTWISPEFELWAMETLAKVVTGEEITNQDRAEGWARSESLGATPTLNELENPFGEWAEVVSLVKAAQVTGVDPERIIELKRVIHHDSAKSVKPPTKPDREIIQEFLQNLQTRQWGESLVRRVNTREGVRLAVYMTDVWPKYEAIFCPTFSQSQLRRAIDATGGKSDSVQKFPNAQGTMIGRCCVVIPILPKN